MEPTNTFFETLVKTATFTNEKTKKSFDLSIGDKVEIWASDDTPMIDGNRPPYELIEINYMFTKNGRVIVNCKQFDNVPMDWIVSINGVKID